MRRRGQRQSATIMKRYSTARQTSPSFTKPPTFQEVNHPNVDIVNNHVQLVPYSPSLSPSSPQNSQINQIYSCVSYFGGYHICISVSCKQFNESLVLTIIQQRSDEILHQIRQSIHINTRYKVEFCASAAFDQWYDGSGKCEKWHVTNHAVTLDDEFLVPGAIQLDEDIAKYSYYANNQCFVKIQSLSFILTGTFLH